MRTFNDLVAIVDKLHGPGGCPWDQSQNFLSLQTYVLEEGHELIEAVDRGDNQKIADELGDLLNVVLFYAKVGEREGKFTLEDILEAICSKLVRRHPHVFGETKIEGVDDVINNWEAIKKQEKGGEERKSALDGIPPSLPTLMRAQKVLHKLKRVGATLPSTSHIASLETEEALGKEMLALIARCEELDITAESALRRAVTALEQGYRQSEGRK
jgi:MazG family protein